MKEIQYLFVVFIGAMQPFEGHKVSYFPSNRNNHSLPYQMVKRDVKRYTAVFLRRGLQTLMKQGTKSNIKQTSGWQALLQCYSYVFVPDPSAPAGIHLHIWEHNLAMCPYHMAKVRAHPNTHTNINQLLIHSVE